MASRVSEKFSGLLDSASVRYRRLEWAASDAVARLNWSRRRMVATGVTIVLALVSFAFLTISYVMFADLVHPLPYVMDTATPPAPATRRLASHAQNETLGFGGIAYLSMPYRSDRQDAMELLASVYGLNFTYIPGVDGATIAEKAKPLHHYWLRAPELGCWRAHVDAWRYLLESDFETLLVLEDDVDFDANVHDVFELLSTQMQHNRIRTTPPTEHERKAAPYGLDWDVLYVGQCSDHSNNDRLDLVHIYEDPNVPSRRDTFSHFVGQLESHGIRGRNVGKMRAIAPSWSPVCTMGYAISRKGAERLILDLSYRGITAAIDIDIIRKLQQGIIRGYTVTPPLFSAWRVDGAKDSDNQGLENDQTALGSGNRRGYSHSLKKSARKEMVKILGLDNWDDVAHVFPERPNPTMTAEQEAEEAEEVRKAEMEKAQIDEAWIKRKQEMAKVMEEWGG
ncbi:hypothetical protein POJ06DRAFT_259742 [Lipomyces tetrasporus]|uniref:Glycosyl transferase family 25 domain-containing protein n=1 Tax=Lipomyces tetrasporus TaxID=54092 RepID=A0AAD7VQK6_9ASCO|nr:uncharacterized protein POJ06DRAFT_259742 [Lipomyces tetrasporus]KAJ8097689.1 hypothetical protein POJ06DRAFT_259742 [Lipomyces tetrasporus]